MLISIIDQVHVVKHQENTYQILQIDGGKGHVDLSFSSDVHILLYTLSGVCISHSLLTAEQLGMKKGECNLFIFPAGGYRISTLASTASVIVIVMTLDFLARNLVPLYVEHKEGPVFPQVMHRHLSIDMKSSTVLHDIAGCAFESHLRGLYLRAKVIELYSLYHAQSQLKTKDEAAGLKAEDIEKITWAKAYIDAHPEVPITIAQLSKQAGTNAQYLKQHFKILHDTTVFSYMMAKRMAFARNLLLSGDYKIAEVAYKSGYKQASHFSSSFKKHFGYLPQKLKLQVHISLFFTSWGLDSAVFFL